MTEYKLTIESTLDRCPFNARVTTRNDCYMCKRLNDPCAGIGVSNILVHRKIDKDTKKSIIDLLNNNYE